MGDRLVRTVEGPISESMIAGASEISGLEIPPDSTYSAFSHFMNRMNQWHIESK